MWRVIYRVCVLSRVWLFATPKDCSPPGSSIYGIFQARTLEWAAISNSRGLTQELNPGWYHLATWKAPRVIYAQSILSKGLSESGCTMHPTPPEENLSHVVKVTLLPLVISLGGRRNESSYYWWQSNLQDLKPPGHYTYLSLLVSLGSFLVHKSRAASSCSLADWLPFCLPQHSTWPFIIILLSIYHIPNTVPNNEK